MVLVLTKELTVFTRKPGLLRRRNRAVTLIEAVLYISIALALIVGGLVFFQQASTAAKTSTLVRQLSATISEAKIVMKGFGDSIGSFDVTPFMISAGAVPPDMVASPTTLVHSFGGDVTLFRITSNGLSFISIRLRNIPQGVCARLLTATSGSPFDWMSGGVGGTTLLGSGYAYASVRPTGGPPGYQVNFIMNPTQAGWMCKYGSLNYYENKTTEPTSTPISGTVTVDMIFILER